MADFPDNIFAQRALANLPGLSFDPSKKQILYAEDMQMLGDEVSAIENALGANLVNIQPLPFVNPVLGTFRNGTLRNAAAGNNIIYSTPIKFRAILLGKIKVVNPGATAITVQVGFTAGAITGILSDSTVIPAGAEAFLNTIPHFVMPEEANLWVAAGTGSGYNVIVPILEFYKTTPLFGLFAPNLVSGDNTIFSNTDFRSVLLYSFSDLVADGAGIVVRNKTGAGVKVDVYVGPAGFASANKYLVKNQITVADGTIVVIPIYQALDNGEEIILKTNATIAGFDAWFSYVGKF
jgi:hypothetical protein